jgi:hypothetical protein
VRSRPPDRGQRLLVLPVPCEGYSVFPLRCQCPFSQLLALSSPAVLFSGAFVIRLLAMAAPCIMGRKSARAVMIRGRFEHEMTDRAGTTPKSSQQQQPPLLTTPDTYSSSDPRNTSPATVVKPSRYANSSFAVAGPPFFRACLHVSTTTDASCEPSYRLELPERLANAR